MSVRGGLLAILTIGPAYGHQLHAELRSRAAHRGPVNVGQIYTTIDRLTKQRLIEQRGSTDDGLPLHGLTAAGAAAAEEWMSVPDGVASADWTEMLDQLLVTSTIDASAARALAGRFEKAWRSELAGMPVGTGAGTGRAALDARRMFATAAIDWLGLFLRGLGEASAFGYAESRPRRGRPGSRTSGGPASA